MPRKANYYHQHLSSTFSMYRMEVIENFNKPSASVWSEISSTMGNKISKKASYTHIRKCQTCADIINLTVSMPNTVDYFATELTDDRDFETHDGSFKLKFDDWTSFIDFENHKLLSNWTNTFFNFLNTSVSRDCIWANKYAKLTNDGEYFFYGEFYCSDCKEILNVYCYYRSENCPSDLIFYYKRKNGNSKYIHKKKHQLRGPRREEISSKLALGQLGVNIRREMALDKMEFGDVESKEIPTLEVLRKAKQEAKEKKSKIEFKSNSLETLLTLKYCIPHNTYLRNIGLDPFFVFYWTPEQKIITNTYCKHEELPTLQLDATGSVVKKISRPNGNISSHVFLYQGVISFANKRNKNTSQIPVVQMLSESHNIETISFWLGTWKKECVPKLKIVVMDHSFALLGAAAKVLAEYSDLKEYINDCFTSLIGNKINKRKPPIYIRVDYSHVIKLIRKWDCFRKQPKLMREFYMRSMANLIRSGDISQFKLLLEYLIVVSNSLFDTTNDAQNECGRAKHFLKSIIAGFQDIEVDCLDAGEIESESGNISEEFEAPQSIMDWIESVYQESLSKCVEPGTRDFADSENFFYLPEFSKSLKKFLRTFTLWSSVLRSIFEYGTPTASSAHVESYFNDLKNRSFVGEALPINIDKFVIKHLDIIQGMMILAKSEILIEDTCHDENTKTEEIIENWKGLGNLKKKKKLSYYSQVCPEIMHITENQKVKIALLLNDNSLQKKYTFEKKQYIMKNTCPFDALAQIMSSVYCDSQQFQKAVEFLDHYLVTFIKDLVKIGTTGNRIYSKRFEILRNLCEISELIDGTLQINCATNVCSLLERIIGNCEALASANEKRFCEKCNKIQKHNQIFLPVNTEMLSESMSTLEDSIKSSFVDRSMCRKCKSELNLIDYCINNQVFIELPDLTVPLKDIPLLINIKQKQFTFRAGIVFHKPLSNDTIGHYLAVCRRNDNTYELYNDLFDKVTYVNKETFFNFNILLYSS